jgi:hemolysin activation/secretion protein
MTPRLKFSIGGSTNDFILNSESAGTNGTVITGKSTVTDAGLLYQIKRTRVNNYSTGIKTSNIKSAMQVGTGKLNTLDSQVQNSELDFDFDLLNEKAHVLHQGSVALISSKFESGGFGNQDKNPIILTVDYSRLSFLKVPFTSSESRLVMRIAGQYAGKSLGAVNQYSLGGPTKSRGFSVNEYYADDSVLTSADWIFKGPNFGGAKLGSEAISSMFQPFMFIDYGYGFAHPFEQEGDGTHAILADIGVGLKLGYTERLHGSLVFAQPFASNIYKSKLDMEQDKEDNVNALNNRMNVYFDLQYSF